MELDRLVQQADENFIASANKFVCVSLDIANWEEPVAVQYGVHSIPKILILDPYEAKVVAEIPWETYQGDMAKLRQQLNAASTW